MMTGWAWLLLSLIFVQGQSVSSRIDLAQVEPTYSFINGGFESPLLGKENPHVFRDKTTAREGAHSLQLASHGTGMASYRVRSRGKVSGTVTIAGWSKGQGVSGAVDENHAVKLQFIDDRGQALSQQNLPLPVGDYDWAPWSHTVTLPAGRTYTVVVYPFFGTTHTGQVWHDGLEIREEPS